MTEEKIKQFKKIHREDTSFATKKQSRRAAEKMLKTCDGFVLFTAHKSVNGEVKYIGNSFIDKDLAAGMPAFIHRVMHSRGPEMEE